METEAGADSPQPPATRGGMLRWGGIFAGLITGYASLMILVAFGLTIWLVIVAAGPHRFLGLLIGGGVWLLVAHAIAAYLAGRATASVAPYATDAQKRLNALMTGMLMLLVLTFYSFSFMLGGMSIIGGAVSSISGMFGGSSKSLTSWAPESPQPAFVAHAELPTPDPEPAARWADNSSAQWLAATSKSSGSSWGETLLRWMMPAARKAAGVVASWTGAWLILAAILLSFAVIGGASVNPVPAAARPPVHAHRQRASTPGA